tara:strand:- start:613 stop:741 length:129 start_codon:yes stop_codon:yes gene_type:complete
MEQYDYEPDDEFDDELDDEEDIEEEYPRDSDDYDYFWLLNWR